MLRDNLAPLDAYLADAASLSRAEFLARYAWPMLVVPEPSPDVLFRIRRPETLIQESTTTSEIDLSSQALVGASLDALCLEVRPKRGQHTNRVSLGRSPDADIVLLDESVSRFHAEILWGEDRDRCFVNDLGARNGTFLDDVRLTAHGRAELYPGAVLTVGALVTRFYSPAAFLTWIETGAPRAGASPGRWPERGNERG